MDFLIISFSIFIAIKVVSKLERKKQSEETVEETKKEPEDILLLKEIRDLLERINNQG